jgi:hypothetical protein
MDHWMFHNYIIKLKGMLEQFQVGAVSFRPSNKNSQFSALA